LTASNQDLFNDVVLNGDEIDDGQFHNSLFDMRVPGDDQVTLLVV